MDRPERRRASRRLADRSRRGNTSDERRQKRGGTGESSRQKSFKNIKQMHDDFMHGRKMTALLTYTTSRIILEQQGNILTRMRDIIQELIEYKETGTLPTMLYSREQILHLFEELSSGKDTITVRVFKRGIKILGLDKLQGEHSDPQGRISKQDFYTAVYARMTNIIQDIIS